MKVASQLHFLSLSVLTQCEVAKLLRNFATSLSFAFCTHKPFAFKPCIFGKFLPFVKIPNFQTSRPYLESVATLLLTSFVKANSVLASLEPRLLHSQL